MLEETVGEKTIRDGLTKYLKKHEFGNAVTDDLWSAISDSWVGAEHNFTVQEMMDTWTLQMGYPIVNFDQNNETNIYTIRQERFFKAASVTNDTEIDARKEEQRHYQWIVPVSFQTDLEDYPQQFLVLNKSESELFRFFRVF